jgi:NAD-dependent SIR2 family protein deacetylase
MAPNEEAICRAGAAIREAGALIIAAGAGMGVDSGLPDFRGPQGFWRAYPPYKKLGLSFAEMANPIWFRDDPALAWGFYGHRFKLYRATRPHAGFAILKKWAARMPRGAFVYTTNVDGHFQRAGFDEERVTECHGSINWLQCIRRCNGQPWPIEPVFMALLDIDEESMRAREPHPVCPTCGGLARPNILMFGDMRWDSSRTGEQEERLNGWLAGLDAARLVIVECGAGTAIPSVRDFSENIAAQYGGTLIRINLREPHAPAGHIELPMRAREALEVIDSVSSIAKWESEQRGSSDSKAHRPCMVGPANARPTVRD